VDRDGLMLWLCVCTRENGCLRVYTCILHVCLCLCACVCAYACIGSVYTRIRRAYAPCFRQVCMLCVSVFALLHYLLQARYGTVYN